MLALQSVSISEGSLHILIAGCPGLECMLLDRSYGFRCVRINSAGLRYTGVRICHAHGMVSLLEVIIQDAPCLEKFLYLEGCKGLRVSVIAAPKLQTVGCIHVAYNYPGSDIISSTTLAYTVKTLAVNFFDLDLDVMVDLLKSFMFLEKLYIQVNTSLFDQLNITQIHHLN